MLIPLVIYAILLGGLFDLGVVIVIVLLGQRELYRLIVD